MFKDLLTFLGLDYRVASLIILYLVVPGIIIPKIRSIDNWITKLGKKVKKINMFIMDVRTFW